MSRCCPTFFKVPTFNLEVGIWHSGTILTDPPDIQTVGALVFPTKDMAHAQGMPSPGGGVPSAPMYLLLEAGTNIHHNYSAGQNDFGEVPLGSGRFYVVGFVDDIAKGYANEHRCAVIYQKEPFPRPMP